MKRVVIVCVLFLLISTICVYSIYKTSIIRNDVIASIDAALEAVRTEDQESIIKHVQTLHDFWVTEERSLVHFVRHSQVDDISKCVERLPGLAEYNETAELVAELDSIHWQIENIWHSELPYWQNIL